MKHLVLILAAALALSLSPVAPATAFAADCYADYKAKRDNPLRLHYGVVKLRGGCSKSAAKSEISARISRDGWKLLNVVSVFDASRLAGKEASAGKYYLRY